jgi:hypothetical protein
VTTVNFITSTISTTKSTKRGVVSYTLFANEFAGVSESVEFGRDVKRIKIGKPIDLLVTQDLKKVRAWAKHLRSQVAEVLTLDV